MIIGPCLERLRRARRWLLLALYEALYGPFARLYRLASWLVSGGRWERWQEQSLSWLEAGPYLDLGCGPGMLLPALRRQGLAIGVDRSLPMARQARRRGAVVAAAVPSLPFRAGAFGGVTATFPAPFIVEASTANEIRRVLRPGGRCVVLPGFDRSGAGVLDERQYMSRGLAELSAHIGRVFYQSGFNVQEQQQTAPGGRLSFVIAVRPPSSPA